MNLKLKSIITILLLVSLISISKALYNASIYSNDLMWSPTVLFWEKINPFLFFLNGNDNERIILSQHPIYHHFTYIFLYPLSLMDFNTAKVFWSILNIIFSIIIIFKLKNIFQLNFYQSIILFIFLTTSTPYRNVISQGQMTMFVLMMLLFFWDSKNIYIKSFFLSFAFSKYSLIISFLFYDLFNKKISSIIAVLFLIIIIIFFGLYTNSLSLDLFIQPIKVAMITVEPGKSDLVSILKYNFNLNSIFVILSCLLFMILIIIYFSKLEKKTDTKSLVILILLILIFSQHLMYDYTILIVLVAYYLKLDKKFCAEGVLILTLYFFFSYFDKFNNEFIKIFDSNDIRYIGFVLLFTNLIYFIKSKVHG